MNHSEPSGCQRGCCTDSSSPPATSRACAVAVADHQASAVPGHVRVVPLDPAQGRAVRRPAWVRHEVGPAHDHLGLGRPDRAGPQVEPDDLVDHVGRACRPGGGAPARRRASGRRAPPRRRPSGPPGDGRLGRDRPPDRRRARGGRAAGPPSSRTTPSRPAPTTPPRRTRAPRSWRWLPRGGPQRWSRPNVGTRAGCVRPPPGVAPPTTGRHRRPAPPTARRRPARSAPR